MTSFSKASNYEPQLSYSLPIEVKEIYDKATSNFALLEGQVSTFNDEVGEGSGRHPDEGEGEGDSGKQQLPLTL